MLVNELREFSVGVYYSLSGFYEITVVGIAAVGITTCTLRKQ